MTLPKKIVCLTLNLSENHSCINVEEKPCNNTGHFVVKLNTQLY